MKPVRRLESNYDSLTLSLCRCLLLLLLVLLFRCRPLGPLRWRSFDFGAQPQNVAWQSCFTFKWQLWRQRLLLSLLQLSCGDGTNSCRRESAEAGPQQDTSKWVTGAAINKQSARQSHSNSSAALMSQRAYSSTLFSLP